MQRAAQPISSYPKTSDDRIFCTVRKGAAAIAASLLLSAAMPIYAMAQDSTDPNAIELEPITVEGTRETGTSPVPGVVAHVTATGSKTDTPIIEIPQAISVITRDQMDQQEVTSVGESLRYTPGVFADSRPGALFDSVFLRGFGGFATSAINPQMLNGLPLLAGSGWATQTIDPFALERVEVLRGPASVLYGQASPGGIVNMISKRPTEEPYHEIGVQVGNRDRLQSTFDFSGPLTTDRTWSYRLTGLASRADTEVDFSKEQRLLLAPTLTWRPDADTNLTVFGYYQNDPDNNFQGWLPAHGTVLPNASGKIPRSFYIGEPNYDGYDRRQFMVGYNFEHRFNEAWTVRQNVRYAHVEATMEGVSGNFLFPFGIAPSELNRMSGWGDETLDGVSLDNQVQYRTSTGPLDHTFLAGLSYQQSASDNAVSNYGYVAPIDYLAPIYGQSFSIPDVGTSTHQTADKIGVYLQDQIRLDKWAFTIGGRQDWSSIDTRNRLANTSSDQSDDAFTGRVGAVYLFDSGFAPYASYSTSFEPTVGTDASGEAYKPSKARQTEVGLRYQPPGLNISMTVSVFDITRENVLTTDPSNPNFSVQTGEVRSRGIEFEGRASLTDNLDLIAAYTYLDVEVTKDAEASIVGNWPVAVPRQMASLWANYRFTDGAFNGLSLGGGVRYIGESAGDAANTFDVPDVTLVDAALRYDLGAMRPALKGWRAAVNVTNLFDTTYVSSCFSTGGCFYGNGRTMIGSLNYQW